MPLKSFAVFEPFGGDGLSQTINYAYMPCIGSLDAWEMDPMRAKVLNHLIPEADVAVCDAFKQVHKLKPSYDVIVIDNNLVQIPFEHFDLFPHIIKGLRDEGFLVISVCDAPGNYYVDREQKIRQVLGSRVDSFVRDWDKARADFYRFPQISEEDYLTHTGRIMPLSDFSAQDMVPIYTDLAIKQGYFTVYHTVMRRSRAMQYILLELKKGRDRQSLEEAHKDKLLRKDAGKL